MGVVNNILIIEDDPAIREGVRILMEGESFHVEEAVNGFEGLKKISDSTHLVILDVMMPGISGYKTCEEIRKKSNVPVLFLTAKDLESDKLLGLMAGGDDYLVKPFSYAELLARVKALLRRHLVYDKAAEKKTEIEIQEEWIENKNIRINTEKNSVYLDEKEIKYKDLGCMEEESVDYPNIAKAVAKEVQNKKAEKGILICRSGLGMSICANKFKGIRCTPCHNEYTARYSRLHNDSNILAMGADDVSISEAICILRMWLATEFEGGRHEERLKIIEEIENENMK